MVVPLRVASCVDVQRSFLLRKEALIYVWGKSADRPREQRRIACVRGVCDPHDGDHSRGAFVCARGDAHFAQAVAGGSAKAGGGFEFIWRCLKSY